MAKYDPLRDELHNARSGEPVVFSFMYIERIVGELPSSARTYRERCSNESSGKHVQAAAWRAAGRLVELAQLFEASPIDSCRPLPRQDSHVGADVGLGLLVGILGHVRLPEPMLRSSTGDWKSSSSPGGRLSV